MLAQQKLITYAAIVADVEDEYVRLTAAAAEMAQRFADQKDFATALIMQQQIRGCRLMRDTLQKRYKT